jgi:hypothetical protein
MREDTRLTSFTLPAIWCVITAVSLAVRCMISFVSFAVCCMTSVTSLPSSHMKNQETMEDKTKIDWRTLNEPLHFVINAVRNLQYFRCCHASFLLCQFI